jgi:ABC-type thiamin/hydroxymethylpyrimidine transport system permease subunit
MRCIDSNVFKTRELALIIILSALGGAVSVPLSYAGNLLNAVPILPFGSPQILSGVHVLWLLLARLLTRRTGAATLAGAVKGLVELSLFSFHGVQVLPISIVEGVVVDLVLSAPVGAPSVRAAVAGGLSASSNVLVLWLLLLQGLSLFVIAFMWFLSLVSGVIVGSFGELASRRTASIIGMAPPK